MRPSGPIPATIAIVGEAPGSEEERIGEPFVGASGRLLTDTLHAVGLTRSSIFITNVCNHRPPKNDISEWISDNKKAPDPSWKAVKGKWVHPHVAAGIEILERHLTAVQPKLVIALGGTALWALTGHTGILKWRGSRLSTERFTVVPSIHPASVLRMPEQVLNLRMDLTRAKAILEGRQQAREYRFAIAPPFHEVMARLEALEACPLVSCDIETRGGAIACIGFAWTPEDALCIPILQARLGDPFYWPVWEEAAIRHRIHKLFFNPNILWIGQNFLYDCQYFVREGMHYPAKVFDTMIGHHSVYSNLRKGLDFLSSMYARDHVYWKDESKNWDPHLGEKQLWTYNCKDACITLEVYYGILEQLQNEAKR